MKQGKPISAADKALLSKCGLLETVNDQLKNLHYVDHSRYRSVSIL
ncbi:TPA: transposase [Acinetobacter baumannii]